MILFAELFVFWITRRHQFQSCVHVSICTIWVLFWAATASRICVLIIVCIPKYVSVSGALQRRCAIRDTAHLSHTCTFGQWQNSSSRQHSNCGLPCWSTSCMPRSLCKTLPDVHLRFAELWIHQRCITVATLAPFPLCLSSAGLFPPHCLCL